MTIKPMIVKKKKRAVSDLFLFVFRSTMLREKILRKRINSITHDGWIDSLIKCCVGEDCHDYGDCKNDVTIKH